MVVGKNKHPYGKPIELHFEDLKIRVSPGYISSFGFPDGKLAIGNSTVDSVIISFQNDLIGGWIRLDRYNALELKNALDEIFLGTKTGFVKKTFSGFDLSLRGKKSRFKSTDWIDEHNVDSYIKWRDRDARKQKTKRD